MAKKRVMFDEKFDGAAEGGIFYRDPGLVKFIKTVEETGKKVVGLVLEDDDSNIELVTEK